MKRIRKHTLSSTNVFPFFFPLGLTTPTGVIAFNLGRSSSVSVYSLLCFFFRFDGSLSGFGLTCFGGGRFTSLLLDTREELDDRGFLELSFVLLEALVALVGAILRGCFAQAQLRRGKGRLGIN